MKFNEIIIRDKELTEEELFEVLKVVIDTLLERKTSRFTKNALKRIFKKKCVIQLYLMTEFGMNCIII